MTDWDSMVDQIQAAMLAVDKAHAATESLREKTDREALEQFQKAFDLACALSAHARTGALTFELSVVLIASINGCARAHIAAGHSTHSRHNIRCDNNCISC